MAMTDYEFTKNPKGSAFESDYLGNKSIIDNRYFPRLIKDSKSVAHIQER